MHARDVRPAIVPAALVAPGTLTSTAAAAGRVALTDMEPGDIVRTSRLGPIGVRGGAAMVRSGQRVVGIAVTDATPAMRSGDLVDVLATYPPAEEQPIRTLLVATATVVDVSPRRVSVAVPTAETRRVVEATVSAQVTLVVRPPG